MKAPIFGRRTNAHVWSLRWWNGPPEQHSLDGFQKTCGGKGSWLLIIFGYGSKRKTLNNHRRLGVLFLLPISHGICIRTLQNTEVLARRFKSRHCMQITKRTLYTCSTVWSANHANHNQNVNILYFSRHCVFLQITMWTLRWLLTNIYKLVSASKPKTRCGHDGCKHAVYAWFWWLKLSVPPLDACFKRSKALL